MMPQIAVVMRQPTGSVCPDIFMPIAMIPLAGGQVDGARGGGGYVARDEGGVVVVGRVPSCDVSRDHASFVVVSSKTSVRTLSRPGRRMSAATIVVIAVAAQPAARAVKRVCRGLTRSSTGRGWLREDRSPRESWAATNPVGTGGCLLRRVVGCRTWVSGASASSRCVVVCVRCVRGAECSCLCQRVNNCLLLLRGVGVRDSLNYSRMAL